MQLNPFALSRRLDMRPTWRLKVWYLRWLAQSLRTQLADLQLSIDEATQLAIATARVNRHSPWLQGQRRSMRERHALLTERLTTVRTELAAMGVQS